MPKLLTQSHDELMKALIYKCIVSERPKRVEDAAHDLKISRSLAQELLSRARRDGIIEYSISGLETELEIELAEGVERALRNHGIEMVKVFASPKSDRGVRTASYEAFIRRGVADLAAKEFSGDFFRPEDHICMGGGRTMMQFAKRVLPGTTELTLRPLAITGQWRPSSEFDTQAVIQAMVSRVSKGYKPDAITDPKAILPTVPPGMTPAERKAILRRPEVQAVFGTAAPPPRLAICSVGWIPNTLEESNRVEGKGKGEVVWPPYVLRLAEARFYRNRAKQLTNDPSKIYDPIPPADYTKTLEELIAKGVVGELMLQALNSEGESVPRLLDEYSIGYGPEILRLWRSMKPTKDGRRTITAAIVIGSWSARALHAAVMAGCFSHLFIDAALASDLLRLQANSQPTLSDNKARSGGS